MSRPSVGVIKIFFWCSIVGRVRLSGSFKIFFSVCVCCLPAVVVLSRCRSGVVSVWSRCGAGVFVVSCCCGFPPGLPPPPPCPRPLPPRTRPRTPTHPAGGGREAAAAQLVPALPLSGLVSAVAATVLTDGQREVIEVSYASTTSLNPTRTVLETVTRPRARGTL